MNIRFRPGIESTKPPLIRYPDVGKHPPNIHIDLMSVHIADSKFRTVPEIHTVVKLILYVEKKFTSSEDIK
jgi:hypothetical protein